MERYERVLKEENWIEAVLKLYEATPLLREAILIASPTLYVSLSRRPLKDPKQVVNSLLNYISRMSTRAVPFGLFSFVGVGTYGESTRVAIDHKKLQKRARPDMEWVYSLIRKRYADENQFLSLPVKTNPLIVMAGDRFFLNYIRETEEEKRSTSDYVFHPCKQTCKIYPWAGCGVDTHRNLVAKAAATHRTFRFTEDFESHPSIT